MNRHKVAADEALRFDVKTRINTHHFNRLRQLLSSSHYRTMSELLRDIICEGRVVVITQDESLDVVMEQLVILRKELNAIGNNLNQIAKALNTPAEKKRQPVPTTAIIEQIQALGADMQPIYSLIARLSKVWLQG
ncbi:MobC family plasmid mobilization relaxosome protein [Pseudoflavitalea sp. X16]|uniref:plasmid mobilization protein n=1 Tax=Paraflavitalea devenefica TaxID=2716334 RepID=UPI0014205348|nr:plasmid mobilization relaxosome protein MobC [Paraflavitalea devenefica]NII26135.1 MobC family plasmid mobilization relaxosome protein [Paraflavitalea devenefica]